MRHFSCLNLIAAIALYVVAPATHSAVRLSDDGLGQALIFPYYTTWDVNGDVYNTYITIVNHTADAKAVRVRFREGRNSREVASFNLYLSPNDAWAGVLQPALNSQGAKLNTTDTSCVSPAFGSVDGSPGVIFTNALYTGAFADAEGAGLDRTREGWMEVIEMGTLDAMAAASVTHGANGTPANCSYVQGSPAVSAGPPTGGISGTLTLINVTKGMDFSVNAVALADLSTRAFFRPASDPYPDFNALEVEPISIVVSDGYIYRSTWSRGVDAVSAVLMRATWSGEVVLDRPTNSNTEFLMTFPTMQHYFSPGVSATPPFSNSCLTADLFRGQSVQIDYFDREESATTWSNSMLMRCIASGVVDFTSAPQRVPPLLATRVLGSRNGAQIGGEVNIASGKSGWARLTKLDSSNPFKSLPTSIRTNTSTGASVTGAHVFQGLPVVGFSVRTFENGSLRCDAGVCQGNYGGAFPLKFNRKISSQ
jgi:hypothetical protein